MLSPIDNVKREWKMAPFVNNYNSLIDALEYKGLVKNTDFFVWNYDWRKPVDNIVSDFNDYVGTLNIPSDTKINIIGHSLGGLIGRLWAQEHNGPSLGKVITLGSPHFGTMDAYEAWNGAIISNNFGISKIALNLLLQMQTKSGQNDLDIIHSYAPVLGDLLPVFDFVKKNNTTVPYSGLFYKNNLLENKNLQISEIFENLETVGATGFESKEYLNLGERKVYDKVLGYWKDGSVLGFTKTMDSDGTVLKKSAIFTDDTNYLLNSKHSELPKNYISGVFNLLGLGNTINPVGDYMENDKLIFFIGSPAYLNVVCNDDIERRSDEMGFVVVDKSDLNNCRVNVVGTGSGTYHLVLGSSANNNGWLYFEDSINESEIKTVDYDVNLGALLLNTTNKYFLYEQLINDITNLQSIYINDENLKKVLISARNKNINDVITDFFNFRKNNKDYVKTATILGEIDLILKIENENINTTEVIRANKKLIADKSLVDRIARLNKTINKVPSEFGANSYKLMDQKNTSSFYSDFVLGSKLAREVW